MIEKFKPGICIVVTTWENDADNYATDYLYGLTEQEAIAIKKALTPFDWKNKNSGYYLGNKCDCKFNDSLFAQFTETLTEEEWTLLDKALNLGLNDEDENSDLLVEGLTDEFTLTNEYFIRCVSDVKFFNFKQLEVEQIDL